MFQMFKKEEPSLYKGFQERRNREQQLAEQKEREQLLAAGQEDAQHKISKVSYRGKAEIAVTSLFHGNGATYLSMILATFFAECKKSKTCLIETKGLFDGEILRPAMDIVTYPCDLTNVYRQGYEFIVRDYGIYDKISREAFPDFERADFKCVVTWPDEKSLSKLSTFVRTVEKADSYIYFFNLVPKERTREILDIMEDYKTIILPCTSMEKLDKNLVTELYKLFGKG